MKKVTSIDILRVFIELESAHHSYKPLHFEHNGKKYIGCRENGFPVIYEATAA